MARAVDVLRETLDLGAASVALAVSASGAKALFRLKPNTGLLLRDACGPYLGSRRSPSAPIRRAGVPTLTTTYFYWYDVKRGRALLEDPDQVGSSGGFKLTHTPVRIDELTPDNIGLHARELGDMGSAGVDVVLTGVFWLPVLLLVKG